MARYSDNYFMDGILDRLQDCDTVTVCAGQPEEYSDIEEMALASGSLSPSDSDIGSGGGGSRRIDWDAQEDLTIDETGEADHVVVDDGENFYVTVCTPQQLTGGGTVTVGTWGVIISAPTAP